MTPSDGVVIGGPGQHKAHVTIEDWQKLVSSLHRHSLGMVDRSLHGLGESCEAREDQRRDAHRHQGGRRAARQGQCEGVSGISVATRKKLRRDAPYIEDRVDRQRQVEFGETSNGAERPSPRLVRQRLNCRPLPRSGDGGLQ